PALIADIQIRSGRLAEAERWAKSAGIAPDDSLAYLREFEHVTLARLLVARGDAASLETALDLLARLGAAAEHGARRRSLIDIQLLAALAPRARHETPAALQARRRAIELAEPEGIRRPLLDGGEAIAELSRQLSRREKASELVRGILIEAGSGPPQPLPDHPDLIEPLSDREID